MEQHLSLQGAPKTTLGGAPTIELTKRAIAKAKALLARDGRPSLGLRVGVDGGGCSGLQYALTFDEQHADDFCLDQDGVALFVDPKSAGYLDGLTLDYVDALHGAGFKFINPNADRTCGCGSSFSV